MKDKAFRTRKRLVIMLSDLASSPKYQEVKKKQQKIEKDGWMDSYKQKRNVINLLTQQTARRRNYIRISVKGE